VASDTSGYHRQRLFGTSAMSAEIIFTIVEI
jgi:hypothetical protein